MQQKTVVYITKDKSEKGASGDVRKQGNKNRITDC